MLPRTYDDQNCSVARSLEVLGDRWTLLVIRDAFLGVRRFDDFQRNLGVARNVLADRLARLVDEGVLERRRYQERPERHEYRLTAKGRRPAAGDDVAHAAGATATTRRPRARRASCATAAAAARSPAHMTCERCGAQLRAGDVRAEPGPGAGARRPGGRRAG